MGGTTIIVTGPAAPMTQDQKRAGRSRAAQRQYRSGACQNRGALPDILKVSARIGLVSAGNSFGSSFLKLNRDLRCAWMQ